MQTTSTGQSPRDDLLRRIGRNVVNFQYLEATLRSMIPSLASEGALSDWRSNLAATARRHKKSSLGDLAGTFLEGVYDSTDKSKLAAEQVPTEITFRLSFRIESTLEQAAEQKRSLLNLVSERNRLIHREVLGVDLESPEQCALLAARLDEQNDRIRAQLVDLNSLREAYREALEEVVVFMQTDEFMSALRGQRDGA